MKSAFITIIGRPSAGKSTLLNRLCGAKVAIVSPVPQTTRDAIRGIVTRPEGQLVFIDTPGLHLSDRKFNLKLIDTAKRAVDDGDLVLYILDASREPGPEEENAAAAALALGPEALFVALNKIDTAGADTKTHRAFLGGRLPGLAEDRVFEISALTGSGTETLVRALFEASPEGPLYYDADCYTDQDMRFRIAEIVREKCMLLLYDEIPHQTRVEIEDIERRGESRLWARAAILCERESQKGMIVGRGGAMIKKIRIAALKDLREIFDEKISLDLRVKRAYDTL